MKLEREPVFGHITLGHKSDPKSFGYNDLSHDSIGLKSGNVTKETQNRCASDFKDNGKDTTQLLYVMDDGDGVAGSEVNFKNCKEYEVKNFGVPFAKSSLEIESLEKGSDDYTDKSVTECEMPEFQVCYRESSYNSVKDICIDEGVPALDNILSESGADMKSLCTFVFPDQDQNSQLNNGHVDIGAASPNGLNSLPKNESEKEFINVLEPKDFMQQGEGNCDATDKIENDISKDKVFPENAILMKELGADNSHPWSPSWDGDAAAQVQISRDKASETTHTISPGFDLAAEKLSNSSEEALAIPVPVSEANESKSGSSLPNDLAYNSKVEKRRITFDFRSLATVPVAKEECPQNGISERLETENISTVDDVMTNMQFVLSQVQHDSSPLTGSREDCFQNAIHECGQTQNMPVVEDGSANAQIVSSNAQQEVAREEVPQNGVCTCVQTPNTSSVNDDPSGLQKVSSSLQHVTAREEGLPSTDTLCCETPDTPMVVDGISGSQVVSAHFQYGVGESSFSAAGPLSGRINYSGPIPYSGSISLRSDSSTTSTRSFAFPVLQSEWNSSPVRMAKADRRHFRKHRGWRQGILCCRF